MITYPAEHPTPYVVFYEPCLITAKGNKTAVGPLMTYDQATEYLMNHYHTQVLMGFALPLPFAVSNPLILC